jgi:hypothetical protein
LLGVSLFLLLFPLALGRPGVPTHLKADEAAYYGMALSLGDDGDLAFEQRDVDRLFDEFPYQPINNLILMSADGWRTVHYGKPFTYSLFAAPFARLGGAHGVLFFNMLLLVAMVWMGTLYLRRYNPEGLAALYAGGFFLLSVGFAYVFWLQPEVFNMAAVTACLFWGLPREAGQEGGAEEGLPRPRRELLHAVLSGVALALAVSHKPMLAIVGVAPLWAWWREHRWRQALAWAVGAAGCLALLAASSQALTGTPSSYLGVQRGGFTLCAPGTMPALPTAATPSLPSPSPPVATTTAASSPAAAATAPAGPEAGGGAAAIAASPTRNSYSWLLRLPDTSPSELAANLGYFLWGRHTGLLLYMPFATLSVVLFLLHARRSVVRWLLLGSATAFALFFLLLIAWNWQGGGGFVGNRYFVNVYPLFLFLVTRVRPKTVIPAGYALAGLFLSPLLLAPFGSPGPEPTLQMHVRGIPFRWFPLELTLRNVPGYQRVPLGDFRLIGRREAFLPLSESMWLHGALPVELWLVADRPLGRLAFQVTSAAPHNRVEVRMGDFRRTLALDAGESARVDLPPPRADREWTIKTGRLHAYRLLVTSSRGRPRTWERESPPNSCPGWPWQAKQPDSFYTGVELLYLGSGEGLDADVYGVRWREIVVPTRVRAGEQFTVRAVVRNTSHAPWPNRGGARVRLAYHWLRTARDGRLAMAIAEGERIELPRALAPGDEAPVTLRVEAPPGSGHYLLALDPVFETVAWFSDRVREQVVILPVEVTAATPATPAPTPQPGYR